MAKTSDNIERQKYKIVNDGFTAITNALVSFAKLLGAEAKLKPVSRTNFWQMAVDQFANVAGVITQITSQKYTELKGDKGDSPSDEQLVALIKPLIPEPLPGQKPSEDELLALIRPLIPKVENGETPSDERILALIKPLITQPDTAEIALEASKLAQEELRPLISSDTPEELADKLGKVKKQWLPIDAIKGDFNAKVRPMVVAAGESKLKVSDENGETLYATKLNFVGEGITVTNMGDNVLTITVPGGVSTLYTETPVGDIDGLNLVYTTLNPITTVFSFAINGMFIHPDEYEIVGNEITFISPLPADLSGKAFTLIYA